VAGLDLTRLRVPRIRRLLPGSGEKRAFFQEFLRHPEQVGSVVPSSRFLEARVVRTAGIAEAKSVVELGPGTGGLTRAVLDALPPDSTLLAVEINHEFAKRLQREHDPRLIVHCGSAADLPEILAQHKLKDPDVVLSGIPFSTMPAATGSRILAAVWEALAPGGRFVAYQLRARVAELGREVLGRPETGFELRNVPPMRIYCWRKPLNGHPAIPEAS
jgi:phospholipid N-methyltransferase